MIKQVMGKSYYSKSELTERAGLEVHQLIECGTIEPPREKLDDARYYYTASQLRKQVAKIKKLQNKGLHSQKEVAQACGYTAHKWYNMVKVGDVEPPITAWMGKKYYTNAQLRRLKANPPTRGEEKRMDLLAKVELCDYLGMSTTTMQWHLQRGNIPQPKTQHRGKMLYSMEEAEKIKAGYKNQFEAVTEERHKRGLYTRKELGQELGISAIELKRRIDAGEIPAPQVQDKWVICYDEKTFRRIVQSGK